MTLTLRGTNCMCGSNDQLMTLTLCGTHAGAAVARYATAEDPGPATRRAPPQLPAGISRAFYIQKRWTKPASARAILRVVCARHKTQRGPRGYSELRNFMAIHAECMCASSPSGKIVSEVLAITCDTFILKQCTLSPCIPASLLVDV